MPTSEVLQTARTNMWPTAVKLHTKLCDSREELEKMVTFILQTELSEQRRSRRIRREMQNGGRWDGERDGGND